ncbi:MAG: alkaline phosphatase family protein [Nitrospiraceae bacterium]
MLLGVTSIVGADPNRPDTLKVVPKAAQDDASAKQAILFVLEGVGQESLKTNTMPTLSKLIKDGSVTWSATAVQPARRLPTMASLITGMSVLKHGMTWNSFEFARGYPRPPTMFDYLDLSGGRDSTIFYMDESLYQLAKPEPYTDHQFCGALRPECRASTLVSYIRQYFKKATSGHGYGHAIPALPHLLIVHLPDAGRIGAAQGWTSKPYREGLKAVDDAMAAVLDLYRELSLADSTVVFATSIMPVGAVGFGEVGTDEGIAAKEIPTAAPPNVMWVASGPGVKKNHQLTAPMSIIDTGATILRALGLETHTEWDSRSVDDVFAQVRR